MKVLVTGGAGFIGAVTAGALVDAGHRVTVVDHLGAGHRDAVPCDAELVVADVTEPTQIEPVLARGFDACLHFAALIEAGESMRAPERFFSVNTAGAARLLELLVRHGVSRFVLSSTAAVYGHPREIPVVESAPLAPVNAYGESKLLTERMLAWFERVHGMRTAILRYFNAAGATREVRERHRPETHLIPRLLEVAAGARPSIGVNGTDYPTRDGTAVRDYVHVSDLADAHVRALERLDELGTITGNLENGAGYSVLEVIAAVERVTGRPVRVRPGPRRDGDPATLVASSDRARSRLDWHPHRSDLDTIVASAWSHAPVAR